VKRKQFIQSLFTGVVAMSTLSAFKKFTDELHEQDQLMPLLFVGHGSPTNAIEDNEFTQRWKALAKEIPVPKAVLVVSAHWLTKGTHVTAMPQPKTIHDFGGFSQELFDVQYTAPGDPLLANEISSLVTSTNVGLDHDWGLDHGAWSIVKVMYPNATIPVLQLSVDYHKPAEYHYNLAKELGALRKKGVLILASGNMVHNLRIMSIKSFDEINVEYGFDWALEMNELFKNKINGGDHQALINYQSLHKSAQLAIPTPDHYYPLLYTLGLQQKHDKPAFFNDKAVAGSLTMTSVKFA
jgi:4,5-DOPA dioxygenase extradiol